LDTWVAVPDLLRFFEETGTSDHAVANALDRFTSAHWKDWQPPSEEEFFARLARTFAYQIEALYTPFAELRRWMSQDDVGFGAAGSLSEALAKARHENDPVTVEQVLKRFAKAILFFSHRTAMGFALTVCDCTPLAHDRRLLLAEGYGQLLEGPLCALANQVSVALEAFESGHSDQLQAWLSFCLAELASKPPRLVNDAAALCFGTGRACDLSASCVEACKASARTFIDYATGTIRLFDERHQFARDAETQKARIAAFERNREAAALRTRRYTTLAIVGAVFLLICAFTYLPSKLANIKAHRRFEKTTAEWLLEHPEETPELPEREVFDQDGYTFHRNADGRFELWRHDKPVDTE
jgi:hypothetical protein